MESSATEMAMLAAGGLVAGVINTMAGGGSLLTVPLLVMLGLPGTVANGTNRVAVLVQSVVASLRFGAEGVPGLQAALPVTVPLVLGATLGALGVSMLADETFERLFGIVMLVLLVPALRVSSARREAGALSPATRVVSALPLHCRLHLVSSSLASCFPAPQAVRGWKRGLQAMSGLPSCPAHSQYGQSRWRYV